MDIVSSVSMFPWNTSFFLDQPTKGRLTMPSVDVRIFQLSDGIAKEFQPERSALFGSHAAGNALSGSDFNLLVMLPYAGKGFYMSLDILNSPKPTFPVDLLAQTSEDTAHRYTEGDPLILEALDNGLALHERYRSILNVFFRHTTCTRERTEKNVG